MVAQAIVIVNAEVGQETKILKKLKEMKETQEGHMVYGAYDIFIIIKAETKQGLKDIINFKIRRLEEVNAVLTMFIILK